MHTIAPFDRWTNLYSASDDSKSPFFGRLYNEFGYDQRIYDHFIHPQWDDFGSETLFVKILFVDYHDRFAIIELIGEWNDCLYNDIMLLKRDLIDELQRYDIERFVLIGEHVLNFHGSDDCYYEEWQDDVGENGWIALLNGRDHVLESMESTYIDQYLVMGGQLNELPWRTYTPHQLIQNVQQVLGRRLGMGEREAVPQPVPISSY